MMTIDQLHQPHLMDFETAMHAADENNAGETEGWTYKVVPATVTNRYIVEVYDEDNIKMGAL